MANLKRNMIELVKNPEEVLKGGEVETERYWSQAFIPFSKVREALQLSEEMEKGDMNELEAMEKLAAFVAEVYGNQFTADDLFNGLHGPDAVQVLQENIVFVAQGVQNESTKNFLEKKKRS